MLPRKSIGASVMPDAHEHLVDEALAGEEQAERKGAQNLVHPIGNDQPQHQEADLLRAARLRHVVSERIADRKIDQGYESRDDEREEEGPEMGGVERPVGRLDEEGAVLLERQYVFRAAAVRGDELRVEALLHHVEIGQHDQEQRPEGDQRNEDDAQHRAVALEESAMRRIMREALLIARHHHEDGDDDKRDEIDEEPTHAPCFLPAAPDPDPGHR